MVKYLRQRRPGSWARRCSHSKPQSCIHRGAGDLLAGVKIKGGAHIDQHGMQTSPHGIGKMVLLGKAQPHEDDARSAAFDAPHDVGLLVSGEGTIWRRIGIGHDQARKPGLQTVQSGESTSGELP